MNINARTAMRLKAVNSRRHFDRVKESVWEGVEESFTDEISGGNALIVVDRNPDSLIFEGWGTVEVDAIKSLEPPTDPELFDTEWEATVCRDQIDHAVAIAITLDLLKTTTEAIQITHADGVIEDVVVYTTAVKYTWETK